MIYTPKLDNKHLQAFHIHGELPSREFQFLMIWVIHQTIKEILNEDYLW